MSYVLTYPYRGFGDAASQFQLGQQQSTKTIQTVGAIGSGIATAAVGTIAAHLAATGGSIIGLSAGALSAAVPFIGPALMGVTMLVQYLVTNSGCGITCVETSEWANQAADALQQNVDAYFALPAPRTKTQQALALANYQTIWTELKQACAQPGTGNAGVRCISDRQAGACKWRSSDGQCFNWDIGYRVPIANDPVVPDPIPTSASSDISSAFSSLTDGSGSSLLPLLMVGGLLALAVSL